MSRLDELPPDQRAALALLLQQRRSHSEVGALLGISPAAVHDRAHAALALLAPQLARSVPPVAREQIGEYLLGQLPGPTEEMRVREGLSSTPAARDWAERLAAELLPLAGANLPEIPPRALVEAERAEAMPPRSAPPPPPPSFPAPAPDAATPVPAAALARAGGPPAPAPLPGAPDSGAARAPFAEAARGEPARAPAEGQGRPRGSRVGGALLLALLVAAVVVAVVLLNKGSSHSSHGATSAAKSTKTSGANAVRATLPLKPPTGSSKAVGIAYVLAEGGTRGVYITAEDVPPSAKGTYYAIWLYNSPTSFRGVSVTTVGSSGRIQGGSLLPSNAATFHTLLLTRETTTHPTTPGPVVLSGAFRLTG